MACFRLVTFRPDPLFSFPFLNAFISCSTLFPALGLYFLVLDFFLLELFFDEDFFVRLALLDFLVAIDFLPFTPVGSRRRMQRLQVHPRRMSAMTPGLLQQPQSSRLTMARPTK
jgi:hypothetical protein